MADRPADPAPQVYKACWVVRYPKPEATCILVFEQHLADQHETMGALVTPLPEVTVE